MLKTPIKIINILVYFVFCLAIAIIKSQSNKEDFFKTLLFSLKKAVFNILSLNYIKTRLIYLIIILPLWFIIFGDYLYLFLNFGLIFNNVKMLHIFMINKDDECLSKI